jgi:glycosyltransferase involved in cell wall biosynthesis
MPKFSIITVCKNAEETLERTIQSVLSQVERDYEYIVIDGESTDKTAEIIERYRDQINVFHRQADRSLYEAMNRGVERSQGEYLYFLNANDTFYNESVLQRLTQAIREKDAPDLMISSIVFEDPDSGNTTEKRYENLDPFFLYQDCICQQALVVKRSVFEEIGPFDISLKIVGDYEWLYRLVKNARFKIQSVSFPLCRFTLGGLSTHERFQQRHHQERKQVRQTYFKPLQRFICRAMVKQSLGLLQCQTIRSMLVKSFFSTWQAYRL